MKPALNFQSNMLKSHVGVCKCIKYFLAKNIMLWWNTHFQQAITVKEQVYVHFVFTKKKGQITCADRLLNMNCIEIWSQSHITINVHLPHKLPITIDTIISEYRCSSVVLFCQEHSYCRTVCSQHFI